MHLSTILISLLACTGGDPGSGQILLTEEVLNFGDVAVGTFLTKQVGLENIGSGAADLLSSTVFEGNPDLWLVDREGEGTLAPGEYVIFAVSFQPTTRGPESARLQIRTDLVDQATLYLDLLGQGTASLQDADGDGYAPADGDCDDSDPDRHPGQQEQCNGIDDDCSGSIPEEEEDRDFDGVRYCDGDCDDDDTNVYPGATEVCDDKDNDCDGRIPDREDNDGDKNTPCDGDCDDTDPDVWPFNEEVCDGKDNNCNTEVDEVDEDRDGVTACEGDCDDYNPDAWPIFVSTTGGTASDDPKKTGADGSPAAPFDTITEAADHIDEICQQVILLPGAYDERYVHLSGRIRIQGGGTWPEDVYLNTRGGSADRIFEASGAGTRLEVANLTLYGTDILGDGGAIRSEGADILLDQVAILNNTVTGHGGAVWVQEGALTILDSELQYNTAGGDGGAIWVDGGTLTVTDSLLASNRSSGSGGGIYATGAIVHMGRSQLWLNEASSYGGGMCLDSAQSGTVLRRLWTQDNLAETGGGLSIVGDGGEALLANSTLVRDSAVTGGGLYASATGGLWVWSNIFAYASGGGLAVEADASISVAYSLGWSLDGAALSIPSDADAGENLESDPAFSSYSSSGSATGTNVTPAKGSPAIDSGPTVGGPSGTSWLDPDGSRNDRGFTGGPE